MWNYGDYEIFHVMNVHLRREERGYHRPPFWKIATPSPSVKFINRFYCESGYLKCHINGDGYVSVDNKGYRADTLIELTRGKHNVEVHVSNYGGLPAVFVESDVCPGAETWKSNGYVGKFSPVGYNIHFTRVDQNPEKFPFKYERILPTSKEKTDSGVIYDFGTELFGFLNITGVNKKDEIGVFYGESREEALDTANSYLIDSVCGEREYRLRQRAFRYVFLKNAPESSEVSADYEYLPLEEKGRFECDNALINNIRSAAAYTFRLNCREAFFDGIKRDRWVWSGDAYQSARINRYLFADKEIEQRTLIGLIGKSPVDQHINTIMDYSLLWIISLYEHYMTYGDKDFLKRIYPMAEELICFCETRLNEYGFIEGSSDDWTFIDWADMEKNGAVCAEQMLLIQAYSVMDSVLKELEIDDRNDYAKRSEDLKRKVKEYYWNEEKGAFVDSYKSGNDNVTRHANIFAVMYGIASEKETRSILENVLKNDNITKISTPYFKGYELDVLAMLGDLGSVEAELTSYWGGMIRLGAKTIWEEYHPNMRGTAHYAMYGGKYEKSLCHAWGAGPIYLFGRYYLGVYATSAGYATFNVEPKLGNLKKINGTVPINGDTVTVSLDERRLSVTATKSGGTLIWNDKRYDLIPNETVVIDR